MRRAALPWSALLVAACATTATPPPEPGAQGLKQGPEARLAGLSTAIAYSGFRRGQHPDRGQGGVYPSKAEILEDLTLLTRDGHFGLIRLYGTGLHTDRVLEVIEEHALPLKVMQGAWLFAEVSNHEGCPWLTAPIPEAELEANRAKNAAEVERVIALAKAHPDVIVAVNIGNEVLVSWTDHLISLEAMRGYLKRTRDAITQPVSVADNYVPWAEHGAALQDVIDFVAVHTYPVWEQKDVDEAMAYSIDNLLAIKRAMPSARLVIAEAGWASTASEFGARASQAKQKQYYEALTAFAAAHNITTFVFEAFDEPWKGNPDNAAGAEKHWGLFTVDRRPKLVVRDLYPDLETAGPEE